MQQALAGIHAAAADGALPGLKIKKQLPAIVATPEQFVKDTYFHALALALIESRDRPSIVSEGIGFSQWGTDIDEASKQQMRNACRLPVAVAAALMPDAHVGYGLPIGGVLACENAVVPYAVGVDIACRMRLSLTDLPVDRLRNNQPVECRYLDEALAKGTRFGAGQEWRPAKTHEVMDLDWGITAVTADMKDRAWRQLGTSGSGNHFVEWGLATIRDPDLGVPPGDYVALLSHSGSRGAGAAVCRRYTDIARNQLPQLYKNHDQLKHLAWLSLDSQQGQEYWNAMNLMGAYAAANHEIIHALVTRLAGSEVLAHIENHHNFAWEEEHQGRRVIVHRKGATPAAKGTLGVIPGNMAAPAYIVRGKGVAKSIHSAAHGAGRAMSRTAAKNLYRWHMWRDFLRDRNVRLLAGGIDEVPGAYKDIQAVMAAQTDLVEILGEFHPKIVMMCGDNSPAED